MAAVEAAVVPVSTFVKPDKPKKAVSAYWIYSCSLREEVTKELKDKNGGKCGLPEIAKEVSARWNALPAEERKVFEDKAAADKERYMAEMKDYNAACDPAAALREKYADLIPKRPASAYSLFCQDDKQKEKAAEALKADGKEPSATLLAKKLQDMWKDISSEDKISFQQEQTKLHLEFLEKEKVWKATPEFAEVEQAEKLQAERKKVVDAAVAQKEAEVKAKEGRQKRMEKSAEKRAAQEKAATPEKSKAPAAKRARTSPKAATPVPAKAQIDASVLAEAAKEGLQQGLENLAARPEVLASGKSARAILDALKAAGGLVNPAKRALLGQ